MSFDPDAYERDRERITDEATALAKKLMAASGLSRLELTSNFPDNLTGDGREVASQLDRAFDGNPLGFSTHSTALLRAAHELGILVDVRGLRDTAN